MKLNDFLALNDDERQAVIERAIDARRVINHRPEELKTAERAAEKIAAGFRINVAEFEALTGIKFSHCMTGKMDGILSLSTNCLCNPVCLARIRAGIGICAECFAASLETQYKQENKVGVFENTAYNAQMLSGMIIPVNMLPEISAEELRIESFGDTANWIQAANYLNIARVNPLVTVTAWTKNPNHYLEAIKRGYSKPENFTLIFSSLELNNPADIKPEWENIIDKRFTVYTLEWLDKNGIGAHFINCGGRSCKNCQRCYKNAKRTGFDVRELLKKDAQKAARRGGEWVTWDNSEPETIETANIKDILAMFGK